MALPQAIQSQVDAAETLQQQLYQEGQASESPPEVPEQPASSEPEAQPVPTAEVIELPLHAEPAPPAPADDASYWKTRFKTVQGKLDKEMPPLYQQLREQNQTIQTLVTKLDEVSKQRAPEAPSEPPPEALVTQKDRDDFGADLVDMAQRAATDVIRGQIREAVAKEFVELRRQLGIVQEQVGEVTSKVVKSEAEQFWDRVIELVPDWPQIDHAKDPNWIAFLDTTPRFSERTYRELAGDAIVSGRADKIAELVKIWKEETTPPSEIPPAAPSAPSAAKPDLQSQVAPSSSKASTTTVPQGRIWSKAEYELAYDVRNVQRYGQKLADEMIADANQAVAEGRVRW